MTCSPKTAPRSVSKASRSDPSSCVGVRGMTRPLRLGSPGAVWNVTSRGNERREILRDDPDRERSVSSLGRTVPLFRWRLYANVLMGNHYHLLVETPEPTLSRGMRQLKGGRRGRGQVYRCVTTPGKPRERVDSRAAPLRSRKGRRAPTPERSPGGRSATRARCSAPPAGPSPPGR